MTLSYDVYTELYASYNPAKTLVSKAETHSATYEGNVFSITYLDRAAASHSTTFSWYADTPVWMVSGDAATNYTNGGTAPTTKEIVAKAPFSYALHIARTGALCNVSRDFIPGPAQDKIIVKLWYYWTTGNVGAIYFNAGLSTYIYIGSDASVNYNGATAVGTSQSGWNFLIFDLYKKDAGKLSVWLNGTLGIDGLVVGGPVTWDGIVTLAANGEMWYADMFLSYDTNSTSTLDTTTEIATGISDYATGVSCTALIAPLATKHFWIGETGVGASTSLITFEPTLTTGTVVSAFNIPAMVILPANAPYKANTLPCIQFTDSENFAEAHINAYRAHTLQIDDIAGGQMRIRTTMGNLRCVGTDVDNIVAEIRRVVHSKSITNGWWEMDQFIQVERTKIDTVSLRVTEYKHIDYDEW